MLDVKESYKGEYEPSLVCDLCEGTNENQLHLLICEGTGELRGKNTKKRISEQNSNGK